MQDNTSLLMCVVSLALLNVVQFLFLSFNFIHYWIDFFISLNVIGSLTINVLVFSNYDGFCWVKSEDHKADICCVSVMVEYVKTSTFATSLCFADIE